MISYKDSFWDEKDSSLCIVMEYADGGDLLAVINAEKKKGKLLSEVKAWSFFIQMVRGL